MSEPNSLFAKIHISKDNFEKFLTSKPQKPKLDNDWLQWWDSKEMYGKSDLQEKNIFCYEDATNAEIIEGWKEAKESLTFSDYDVENEIWYFGIIMFSENYFEMIPGLAFIKSVSEFKTENKDDFAIIYSYFWGGNDINAFISYENGNGLFNTTIQQKSDVDADALKNMEAYLSNKWDEFAASGLMED